VRIGFTGTAVFAQLPRITRVLQQELPGVTLEMHADLLTPAQCEGLRDSRLDLGVLRPPVDDDQVAVRTIEMEPLVAALPVDHPLASARHIRMSELRTEPFVVYADRDSAVNEATVRSCREAGFTPRREHEATGTTVLLAQVAAGRGIALVPGSVRAVALAGVVFRDVADAVPIEIALAWRRGAHGAASDSPLVRSVVDALDAAGALAPLPGPPVLSPSAPEVHA
jgi:DNA-binding transcriptional LysR family regulator